MTTNRNGEAGRREGGTSSGPKGAPHVTRVRLTKCRSVILNLSNCERTHSGTGHMFMPDTLLLEWRDDALTRCDLIGRRLREDSMPWLDGRRTFRQYLHNQVPPYTLDQNTPDWIRGLIELHGPEEVTSLGRGL